MSDPNNLPAGIDEDYGDEVLTGKVDSDADLAPEDTDSDPLSDEDDEPLPEDTIEAGDFGADPSI